MVNQYGPEAAERIIRDAGYPTTLRELKASLCNVGYHPALVEDGLLALLNLDILRIAQSSIEFDLSLAEPGPAFERLDTACAKVFDADINTPPPDPVPPTLHPKDIAEGLPPEGLCATLPLSRTETLLGRQPLLIRRAVNSLIRSARQTLDISSPYLDVHGISSLEDAFMEAASKEVRIRVLTRIEYPEQPDVRLIQGLLHLLRLFGEKFNATNLAYLTRNPTARYANVTSAVHAKIVICDRVAAYIGSADLRHMGLHKNFEIGMVLHGEEQTELVADLFETAWASGELIESRYIEQKAGLR